VSARAAILQARQNLKNYTIHLKKTSDCIYLTDFKKPRPLSGECVEVLFTQKRDSRGPSVGDQSARAQDHAPYSYKIGGFPARLRNLEQNQKIS
jgi:hypothetical protein